MRRFVWVSGRLSWPFVIVIVYVTAALICFDYLWRVVVIPFDMLLIYAAIGFVALPVLLIGFYGCVRWWRQNG
jgi:hypothetical protein